MLESRCRHHCVAAVGLERLLEGRHLHENEVKDLCNRAKAVLSKEPNVARASSPVTLVGDIHGQLHDFIELMKIGGQPPVK